MHLIKAFINSLNGLKQTWLNEKAFKLEVTGTICVLPFVLWNEAQKGDKLFVIFSLSLMLIAELINTAIEKANDAFKKEKDPLIKFSKDAASASVLIAICLVGMALINLFFF